MNKYLTCLAVGIFLLSAGAAAAMDQRRDDCGAVIETSGYSAQIGGLSIDMPSVGELRVNGETIASLDTQPWADNHNTASVAVAGSDILVVTMVTNCVDSYVSHLFVLDAAGKLRADADLPGPYPDYAAGLWRAPDGIAYWSDKFCYESLIDPGPAERKPNSHYLFLKDGGDAFVREDRPTDSLCQGDDVLPFGNNRLTLERMTPKFVRE